MSGFVQSRVECGWCTRRVRASWYDRSACVILLLLGIVRGSTISIFVLTCALSRKSKDLMAKHLSTKEMYV